jgi:hypothetical protein
MDFRVEIPKFRVIMVKIVVAILKFRIVSLKNRVARIDFRAILKGWMRKLVAGCGFGAAALIVL